MSKNHFSIWREAKSSPSILLLEREIRRALRDCRTILDVGCGCRSPLRYIDGVTTLGLDGYQRDLDTARAAGTHDEYLLADVRNLASVFPRRRFDACIAMDVIEHLTKEDGWKMIENVERIATRRVVIFTPNGFIPQTSKDGDLQEHLSGWTVAEMRQRGYRVIGMYGWKPLRGEHHVIRFRPKSFWVLVAMLSHWLYTRRHPEAASGIFCVKNLDAARRP